VIKLNLLPSHIFEAKRIIITIIVSVVLIAMEWGFIFAMKSGVNAQVAWFDKDTSRINAYKGDLDKYVTEETTFKSTPDVYVKWIDTFGQLQPFKEYASKIAVTLAQAAQKIGGGGAWFTDMKVEQDGKLSANGSIKGSMQFLNYYFRIRDLKGDLKTLAPAVVVKNSQLGDTISVTISWPGAASGFPTPPDLPDTTPSRSQFDSIFLPSGGGAAAPAAGGPSGPAGPPATGPSAPPAVKK